MSVATWLHALGTSASIISKTIEPLVFLMRLVRFSYCTSSSGSLPGVVKTRWTDNPSPPFLDVDTERDGEVTGFMGLDGEWMKIPYIVSLGRTDPNIWD